MDNCINRYGRFFASRQSSSISISLSNGLLRDFNTMKYAKQLPTPPQPTIVIESLIIPPIRNRLQNNYINFS